MLFILIVCAASVADLVHATAHQCRLAPHPSVEYRCLLSGSAEGSRLCGAAEPAYTVVTPRCRPLHYSPTSLGYMECLDGNWNYVAKCVPDCGRVTPLGTKLVVGGKPVKRGELPWHAGIYQKISNPPMQICGGSLISKDVVLSAAHCFWSEKEKQLPASQFAVAVGKLYRPWNDPMDLAQKSDVKVIHVPPRYQGASANFQDDVAVVIVAQEFHFQNHIRPVCLNFDYHFEAQQLYAGNKGKVAGWGLTAANGNASSVLKVVDMPFVEVGTCIASAPPDFYEYITSDKICAGTLESDVAVCKGDSGGGLAFSESIRGIARYYLRGIVSTAPNNENACNTDTYTSFTSIMKHEYFIKQFWSESGEFRCRDGSYITAANYCDGTKDCADGSDETTSACSGKTCSSYLFQCDYGACVDTGATCNGVPDCADGSDEADRHCGAPQTRSGFNETKAGECVLPPYPEHGSYDVNIEGAKPGEGYERVTITNVECEFGYGVLGSTAERFYCFNGVWTDILPKCVRMCELERHPSVEYRCLDSDDDEGSRACGLLEHNGTVVSPRCQQPNYYTMTPLALMRCVDGEWDYIAKCTPECGRVTPAGMPLALGGQPAKRAEIPWHAGIYTKTTDPYALVCGGSLVSTSVVISAASCFWTNKEKQPSSQFAVAVGKLNRPWDDTMDDAQKSDVEATYLAPRFNGNSKNLQDDIAVVVVAAAFEIRTYVRPVCLNFEIDFDERQLKVGNKGKVAGWGLTSVDGDASPELQVLELPYVEVDTCIASSPPDFVEFITSDKICAGTKEPDTAVCKGDAGGGLVFAEAERDGSQRHYLRGIVSIAPASETACNTATYTAFTHIRKHEDFLRKFVVEMRNKWKLSQIVAIRLG